MTTATELITSAMRLAGVLASGETPGADEWVDGLKCLNDVLENWSLERLSVWQTENVTFNAVAGTATYSIGPGATWNTTRPVRITGAYAGSNGASFTILPWGQLEYDAVGVKSAGGMPERLLYINGTPQGSVTLYPVPATSMTLTLSVDRVLSPVTLATVLSFPIGYEKALRYALAVELAPEYGMEVSTTVLRVAAQSKADVKRSNTQQVLSGFDPALRVPNFVDWRRGDY